MIFENLQTYATDKTVKQFKTTQMKRKLVSRNCIRPLTLFAFLVKSYGLYDRSCDSGVAQRT